MDKNVQRLLEEEQQVNKGVQAAIEKKNELMKSIKKESEIAVRNYKKELEHTFEESLNKVSPRSLLTRRAGQGHSRQPRYERPAGRRYGCSRGGVRGQQS